MKTLVPVLLASLLTTTVDRADIVGKWRFSKINPGDGHVLDLEKYGIGAEWSFQDDGVVVNLTDEHRGKWTLDQNVLRVRFNEASKIKSKEWSIKSIDNKEMVVHRELADGKTAIEHLRRIDDE